MTKYPLVSALAFMVLSHMARSTCEAQPPWAVPATYGTAIQVYQDPRTVTYYYPSHSQSLNYATYWQPPVSYSVTSPYCAASPILAYPSTTTDTSPSGAETGTHSGDDTRGSGSQNASPSARDRSNESKEQSSTQEIHPEISLPVRLVVNYDGLPQSFHAAGSADEDVDAIIEGPLEGERVTFELHSGSDQLIYAVLLVNGISVLHEERGDPRQMKKWVILPRQSYLLEGFYQTDNSSFVSIEGMSQALSKAEFDALGGPGRAGWIHLFLFEPEQSGTNRAPLFVEGANSSFGTLKPHTARVVATGNGARQAARLVRDGGLMAWGLNDGEARLQRFSPANARLIGSLVVRYYIPAQ